MIKFGKKFSTKDSKRINWLENQAPLIEGPQA